MSTADSKPIILVCLIGGLPGLGKSTVAKHLHHSLPATTDESIDIIEFDDVFHLQQLERGDSASSFSASMWHEAYDTFLHLLRTKLDAIICDQKAADIDKRKTRTILVIDNFYYKSMRARILKVVRDFNNEEANSVSLSHCFFTGSEELCLSRNSLRIGAAKVPDDVIISMTKKIEYGQSSPGLPYTEVRIEENTAIDVAAETLHQFIMDPTVRIGCFPKFDPSGVVNVGGNNSTSETATSWKHDLDLALRQEASSIMSAVAARKDPLAKKLGKRLADVRKLILKKWFTAGATNSGGTGGSATNDVDVSASEVAVLELQSSWVSLSREEA